MDSVPSLQSSVNRTTSPTLTGCSVSNVEPPNSRSPVLHFSQQHCGDDDDSGSELSGFDMVTPRNTSLDSLVAHSSRCSQDHTVLTAPLAATASMFTPSTVNVA